MKSRFNSDIVDRIDYSAKYVDGAFEYRWVVASRALVHSWSGWT